MAFPGYSSWCAPVQHVPRGYCTTASQSHGAWHVLRLEFLLLVEMVDKSGQQGEVTFISSIYLLTLDPNISVYYALCLRNVSPWMICLASHAILCLIHRRLFGFMGATSSKDESTLFVCDDTAGVKTLNLSAFSQGGAPRGPLELSLLGGPGSPL